MPNQRKHFEISCIIKPSDMSVINQVRNLNKNKQTPIKNTCHMNMHLIAPTKFVSNRQHRALSGAALSTHWGLSPGPSVYRTDALPLSYKGHAIIHATFAKLRQMPYTRSGTISLTWLVLPGLPNPARSGIVLGPAPTAAGASVIQAS